MAILGLILLICGFVPFAGTCFLMYWRRHGFTDPAGWEAYQAARQMGKISFTLTLVLSLGVWAWCGHHIVTYELGSGGIIDLGWMPYLAGCLLPLIGLAGSCLAWLWTVAPPSQPQPNSAGFTGY
ncbi:hypothetical protein IV102_10185 [bacterium]|nr:hypothetical protein [bacterium]